MPGVNLVGVILADSFIALGVGQLDAVRLVTFYICDVEQDFAVGGTIKRTWALNRSVPGWPSLVSGIVHQTNFWSG